MRKRIFSGVQPSGNLHIGNYLGAIKRFVELQEEYEVILCIVDEHAITVPQEPEKLRTQTLEVAAVYLACGIDPTKSIVFVQSHVPAHAELGWLLNTFTPMGELERMTQYKEKRARHRSVFAGLFNYPTLMAADILLYEASVVPVGEDQLQHIELTRSLAERFNNRYGKTFVVPEGRVKKETARILSLDDPAEKMSKSDENDRSRINLTDSSAAIREKIQAAVTDSGHEIVYDLGKKPAISNLLVIFSEFAGKPIGDLEQAYAGRNYADFKKDLAEAVVNGLVLIQERLTALKNDEEAVRAILREGSAKAAAIAEKTLAEVKQRIGFLPL